MDGSTAAYTTPFKQGEPLYSWAVAQVIDPGESTKCKRGDVILSSETKWEEYCTIPETSIFRIPEGVDNEAALGVCGMPGATAYLGLTRVGKLKQGETILVSGGAGAVGSVVGQIAKIMGCKVIGIAGSDEKVQFMKEIGFDCGINYKTVGDLTAKLKQVCPNGVDLYWDNVGGTTLDAALLNLKIFGRVVQCGTMSSYNAESPPQGLRIEPLILTKRLRVEGFIVFDFVEHWNEAVNQLAEWYKAGKIKKRVTVKKGFDNLPTAFLDMMKGHNVGKMLVQV
jgi:NADPH-dependent curcumin reductase CurA